MADGTEGTIFKNYVGRAPVAWLMELKEQYIKTM